MKTFVYYVFILSGFLQELAGMSQSHGDILEMTYDWITRVLYLSVSMVMVENTNSNSSRFLTIWSLPVDNPVFRMIYKGNNTLSDDTKIVMTISPRTGYVLFLYAAYVFVCVCLCVTCVHIFIFVVSHRHLYWTETSSLGITLNQLNLVNGSFAQLYQSTSLKRSVSTNDSSSLDSVGPLTPALTYDVVTDRLWVSTVAGDIWSCDLNGCNCSREVNGTVLLQGGMLSDISMYIEY